ncbi:hypothetical protein QF004_001608 [Chryseobacterium sp. MDT2-18]|nr:hypothetical protein [Chryseobacterium sp. MDT2-18]
MVPPIFLRIYTNSIAKKTRLHYIIRAEYHLENVMALKFYCKKDRGSQYKYNKIINKGNFTSVIRILDTCTSLILILLEQHPNCSFGLCSSRSIDFSNPKKLTENLENNQRFRVYSKFIQDRIGNITFTHLEYPSISSYLLINNSVADIRKKEEDIVKMFERTYNSIPDIGD